MPYRFNPLSNEFDITQDLSSIGAVGGPGSSTDNALMRWDGATGTLAQDSIAILTDGGILTGLTRADIGNIRVTGNTISSINSNGDINLTPDGTGVIAGTELTLTTDLEVQYGGTGASTLTDGGILLGSGSGAITATAQPTNGQLLIGSTGVDPVLGTLTAGSAINIVNGAGSITISSTGDVAGPGSSTDNAIARYDGVTGKVIQNSGVIIDDDSRLLLVDGSDAQPAMSFQNMTNTGIKLIGTSQMAYVFNGSTIAQMSGGQTTINNRLDIVGGRLFQRDNEAGNVNLNTSDTYIAHTDTTAPRADVLPAATAGQLFVIKDESGGAGTNNITITATGGKTIDGAANHVISKDYGFATFIYDGTNYFTLAQSNDGNVVAPASSTDNAIARFDGTTGRLLQNSSVTISDSGYINGPDGVLATPTYAFTSSPSTGYYYTSGPDRIQVGVNGANVWAFGEFGNLCQKKLFCYSNADVDNIGIATNTISSLNANGDIIFTPNGSGDIVLTPYTGIISSNGASGCVGRTITGTASRISISNGDGVAGNPTIDIDASYVGQASITTLGTITTGTWNGTDIAVADGGTGRGTATAYAVLCGGTTATGAHQSIASVGTAGQVLTSNGAGALPTFQAASGGVSGPGGGSTDNALARWDGAGGNTLQDSTVLVSDNGEMTNPSQPAFFSYLSTTDSNVTGNGTLFQIGSGNTLSEVFDQNGDINSTGTFTAPVTGRYYLYIHARCSGVSTATNGRFSITTSNNNFIYAAACHPSNYASASVGLNMESSVFCDMDAADTATFSILGSGEGSDTWDVIQGATATYIMGYLVC